MSEKTEKEHAVEEKTKEVVDLENYVKTGKDIPKGVSYRIRIDRDYYIVNTSTITGRQLLLLAKKVPIERFQIFQKFKGGASTEIMYDSVVDLAGAGIERFYTLALDQTEGA